MSIYIDSADLKDIEQAIELGYVHGVTTNPLLLADVRTPWRERLREICELSPGKVYYQLDTANGDEMREAAQEIHAISPDQIILKIPATPEHYLLAADISRGIPCCMTAVSSAVQMMAAYESGTMHIAVYVNRISRFFKEGKGNLAGDGCAVLRQLRHLIDLHAMATQILAASLKSPEEVVGALEAGAHHVTTTLEVLRAMASHPLADEAAAQFADALRRRKE